MNTSCSDIQLSEHIVCSGKCLSAPMDADKFLQEHTVCANKAELNFIAQPKVKPVSSASTHTFDLVVQSLVLS